MELEERENMTGGERKQRLKSVRELWHVSIVSEILASTLFGSNRYILSFSTSSSLSFLTANLE